MSSCFSSDLKLNNAGICLKLIFTLVGFYIILHLILKVILSLILCEPERGSISFEKNVYMGKVLCHPIVKMFETSGAKFESLCVVCNLISVQCVVPYVGCTWLCVYLDQKCTACGSHIQKCSDLYVLMYFIHCFTHCFYT